MEKNELFEGERAQDVLDDIQSRLRGLEGTVALIARAHESESQMGEISPELAASAMMSMGSTIREIIRESDHLMTMLDESVDARPARRRRRPSARRQS